MSTVSAVVLELGRNTGALVLYTPAELDEREIEISRAGASARTHSQVHRRQTSTATVYAAVYPDLPAGDYTIWRDAHTRATTTTVTGGSVTTCHWPE